MPAASSAATFAPPLTPQSVGYETFGQSLRAVLAHVQSCRVPPAFVRSEKGVRATKRQGGPSGVGRFWSVSAGSGFSAGSPGSTSVASSCRFGSGRRAVVQRSSVRPFRGGSRSFGSGSPSPAGACSSSGAEASAASRKRRKLERQPTQPSTALPQPTRESHHANHPK